MSERLLSKVEWTPNYESAARKIGDAALNLMVHRYGDGQSGGEGGFVRRLWYHHLPHAQMVGNHAAELCERMGLSTTEQKMAQLAGFAHDILQLEGSGTNEVGSATWLNNQLSTYGIDEFREPTMRAIIGTIPVFKNGILTSQKAHELPDGPNSKMIKSVASVDLGGLYTPIGPHESHALYAELQGAQPGEAVSLDEIAAFQRGQIALLEDYTYPVREAEILATHRKEVMAHHTDMLRRMEAGTFDSFDEVLDLDELFRLRHTA